MSNKDLADILIRNFNLVDFEGHVDTESEYLKRLQLALSERIIYLIKTDLDKLLQILYRIDVPQKYSDEAFALGEINQISMELAKQIINRQLQKIDYARSFNKENKK